jgi:hypothetical protein
MSTQHPEQVVRPDRWTLCCADCSQRNENYDGSTSPGGKGMPYADRRVGYEKK